MRRSIAISAESFRTGRSIGRIVVATSKRTRFAGKSRRTSFLKRSRSKAVSKQKVTFWPAARQSFSSLPSEKLLLLLACWQNSAKARRHPISAKSRLESVALNGWSACLVMARIQHDQTPHCSYLLSARTRFQPDIGGLWIKCRLWVSLCTPIAIMVVNEPMAALRRHPHRARPWRKTNALAPRPRGNPPPAKDGRRFHETAARLSHRSP